jgi:S1-C subfamily serine protease
MIMNDVITEVPNPEKERSKWGIGCAVGGVVILCLLVFVVVGGFGWLLTMFGGEATVLSMDISTPSEPVTAGDEFTIDVILTNGGEKNVSVNAILLPNSLLDNVRLLSVDPAGALGVTDGTQTAFDYNMTIAPTGRERVVFRFEAVNPVNITGQVTVDTNLENTSVPMSLVIAPGEIEAVSEPTSTAQLPLAGDVIPYRAVVQIIALINLNGQVIEGWTGSGTVISEDGLILTNAHVVLSDRFYDVVDLMVSITTEQDQPPVPLFYADVLQADANLDLAVIKVRSDITGGPANFSALGIEPVKIGRAESLQLGDPIIILGYPGIGGETITLTRGEVSGFTSEAPYGNRAFIKTSATIAGGNSGGLAATPQGEIIGVPTQVGSGDLDGAIVDCRPLADTNRDGVIDERDNCVPTGGFINALRPVNLAQPMIDAALAGQVAILEEPTTQEPQDYEQEGEVVLFDEFLDNRNNWFLSEFNEGLVDIQSGQLAITVTVEKTYIYTTMPQVYSDLILVVDARVLQATGDGDFGFICGYVDDRNYSVLEISEDGYYAIWTLLNDEEVWIVDWTPSDMISNVGTYTLAAYCGADGYALAVDDILLVDVDSTYYRPGGVGLFTGTWSQPNIRVGFTDFAILLP